MPFRKPHPRRHFFERIGSLALGSLAHSAHAADAPKDPLIDRVQLDRVRSGYDKKYCWVHPRAGVIPGVAPTVVMTMQELLLSGSDVFGPLHEMRTADQGKSWI